MKRYCLITFTWVALICSSAWAHHSGAPFDFAQPKKFAGVVKVFEVTNPHIHATLVVKEGAREQDLHLEGVSASIFYRLGYTRGMIKPGDTITVTYAPFKDGRAGGSIIDVVTADGRRVGLQRSSN